MIVKLFLINTFIDGLFSGGRALVAIMRGPGQAHLLQALASELHTPVTAYVLPYPEGFAVRYFSACGELDCGGYAALAVAKAIYFTGLAPPDQPLRLEGRKGPVVIRPADAEEEAGSLVLSIPAQDQPLNWEPPKRLGPSATLGQLTLGQHHLVCLAESPEAGLPAAAALSPGAQSVLSWPLGEDGYGLRCFRPAGEAAEMPLSLDFHAVLGPFWAQRLHRKRLDIHHLASRPAFLRAEITAGGVELSGLLQIVYKAVPDLSELAGPGFSDD